MIDAVLMPREATREMTMAGCDCLPSCEHVFGYAGEMLRKAYLKMVEAGQIRDGSQAGAVRIGVIERMVTGAMEASRLETIEECAKLVELSKRGDDPEQIARGVRSLALTSNNRGTE